MDRFNLDPYFVSDFSFLQELKEGPLVPTDPFSSQPSMAGYSAQIFNPPHSGYFNHEVTSQDIPSSSRPLNDFSISPSPYTTNELEFPEISQEVLDEIVPCDFANEPVDDFTFTDLTSTNSQQIAKQLPSGPSSATLSQASSHPVAMVTPLHKNAQQHVQTKAESANPSLASGIDKAAKANEQSPDRKAAQANYRQSPAGKATKAKYVKSPVGKATNAKYNAKSPAGKAAQAKYCKSPAGKAVHNSAQAKYQQTPAGKAAQAIRNAKYNVYRKELTKSGNENLAKQKGVEAAKRKELELQNNNVDQIAPPTPLFSRIAEGIFTLPIEPISP